MIENQYSLTFKFTPDAAFDSERSSILWELGTHSLSISYPNMTFIIGNVRWHIWLGGVGVKGYYYYKDNSDITITTVYDAVIGKLTIYVDGYLLAEKSIVLPSINKELEPKVRTGNSYDKFSGVISLVSLSPTAIYIEPLPEIKEKLRFNDYPLNYVPGSDDYTNVATALEQLAAYPTPRLEGSNPTASCMNMLYFGGYGKLGKEKAIQNALALQTILTNKYNWELRVVDSLSVFYAEKNLPINQSLSLSLIELAKNNLPNALLSIGTAWAHVSNIAGFRKANLDSLTPDSPLSELDGDRGIYKTMSEALKTKLDGLQITRHHENDEYITGYSKFLGDAKTAEIVNYVMDGLRDVLKPTASIEYDVHSPWFYSNNVFKFKPRMPINTNGKGTIQFYPRYAWNWREWSAADRGLNFYMNSKIQELKDGFTHNTPYICFGWDKTEENNIRPAQALGLAKILKVAGSSYFFSSYFTIGQSGVQEPKGYAWQTAVPAYVEDAVIDYKHIIDNGELLKGDVLYNYYYKGEPEYQYNFKTGDKAIYCVARRLGDEYLIGSTYQPLNNFQGQENTKPFTILLDGLNVTMKARRQGSVYYYNKATGKLKMIDQHHKQQHFERWSSAKEIE